MFNDNAYSVNASGVYITAISAIHGIITRVVGHTGTDGAGKKCACVCCGVSKVAA